MGYNGPSDAPYLEAYADYEEGKLYYEVGENGDTYEEVEVDLSVVDAQAVQQRIADGSVSLLQVYRQVLSEEEKPADELAEHTTPAE